MSGFALEWCEEEFLGVVAFEDEINGGIAKTTNAIEVDDDLFGGESIVLRGVVVLRVGIHRFIFLALG